MEDAYSDNDNESHDVVRYELSPIKPPAVSGQGPPPAAEHSPVDVPSSLPFDSIVQHAVGQKRGRLAEAEDDDSRTPSWSRRPPLLLAAAVAAVGADGESPATLASEEQTARLLAAVAQLQEELQRRQQLRSQDRSGVEQPANEPPERLPGSEQRRSAAAMADASPAVLTSAMVSVLAEARSQILSASKAAAAAAAFPAPALDDAAVRKRPRAAPHELCGAGASEAEATTAAVLAPAGIPTAIVTDIAAGSAAVGAAPVAAVWDVGGDDDDAALAALYDAVEAAAFSQLAASSTSTAGTSMAGGAGLTGQPMLGVGARSSCANAAAAQRVISVMRERLSPPVKGMPRLAVGSPSADAGGAGCPVGAPHAPPCEAVISSAVQQQPPLSSGLEPPLAVAAVAKRSADMQLELAAAAAVSLSFEDDFGDEDLRCLDALEQALCGPSAPPPVRPSHLLPGVQWLNTANISPPEVRRLLGQFGRLPAVSGPTRESTSHDPSKLLPAHLRCVVVAVSRIHTASCRMRGAADVPAARPAAPVISVAVRQRLWRVRFLRPSLGSAGDVGRKDGCLDDVAEAYVAVRGQWLECSRVTPGTVVNVVAVRRGRAVSRSVAERMGPGSLEDARFAALRGDAAHEVETADEALRLGIAASATAGDSAPLAPLVLVDDAANAVVVHPDLLLAPTRIAGVSFCLRRAVLNEILGDAGGADAFSYVAELGTLKHGLFEAALRVTAAADTVTTAGATSFSPQPQPPWVGGAALALRQHLEAVAHDLTYHPAMLLKLVSSKSTDVETLSHLVATIPGIVDWMGRYAARQPDAPVHTAPSPLVVRRLVGAEDEIWSPLFGLRGIVDSTVDVEVVRPAFLRHAGVQAQAHGSGTRPALLPGSGVETTVSRRLPLELKTGRRPREGSSVEHRAQVALYDLLMAERYGRGDEEERQAGSAPNGRRSAGLSTSLSRRIPATVPVPADLILGAYQADGQIDAVGGLLVYLSAPDEQAAAAGGGRGGGGGGGDAPRFHYTSMVPALWPEQRGLLIMRNKLAAAVLEAKARNAGLDDCSSSAGDLYSASCAVTQPGDASGSGGGASARATSLLPPLLQSARACSKCSMFAACAAVYVSQELPDAEARAAAAACVAPHAPAAPAAYGDEEDAGVPLLENLAPSVKGLYADALRHVSPALRSYLRRWLRLVDLEASAGLLVAGAAAEAPAAAAGRDIEDLAIGPSALRGVPKCVADMRLRAGADHRSRLWIERAEDLEDGLGTSVARLVLVRQGVVERRSVIAARARAAAAAEEDAAAGIAYIGNDADVVPLPGGDSGTAAAQFLYTFVTSEAYARGACSPDEEEMSSGGQSMARAGERSLMGLEIDVGDLVTASGNASTGPFGLLRGTVERKCGHALVVRGDCDVTAAFSWALAPATGDAAAAPPRGTPWLWRIDRDELSTSTKVIKDNLVRLVLGPTVEWGAADEAPEEDEDAGVACGAGGAPAVAAPAPAGDFGDDDAAFAEFDFTSLDAAAAAAANGRVDAAQALLSVVAPPALPPPPPPPPAPVITEELPAGVGRGDTKRQRLLVDLAAPRFFRRRFLPWRLPPAAGPAQSTAPASLQPCASSVSPELAASLVCAFQGGLNGDQRTAVDGCLRARDFACILGMPGSGKTSTVAFIVRCIVAAGRSVLITSHTHSAVDTLLLKVTQGEGAIEDVMRLGRPGSVHPALRRFCIEEDIASGAVGSVGQLRYRMASAAVVGATCLAARHALFTSGRRFDYAIVDEASQIPEPIALGPLRAARVFILVGDHHQLPPLVVSRQALAEGMDESLFKRLADAHPAAVFALTQQYRMNADIQLLPNALCYEGALKCATPGVAAGRYHLPDVAGALASVRKTVRLCDAAAAGDRTATTAADVDPLAWLTRALADETTVLFLDTDGALPPPGGQSLAGEAGLERRSHGAAAAGAAAGNGGGGSGLSNETEAALVALLCHAVVLAGGAPEDIGVIAPYRAQLRLIRTLLLPPPPPLVPPVPLAAPPSAAASIGAAVEVETVDRYQGRDKPLIILSCVRSNSHAEVGALLGDVRRLNVALSRAKFRLVLVGSRRTLAGGCPAFARVLGIMEQRGWVQALASTSGHAATAALAAMRGSPQAPQPAAEGGGHGPAPLARRVPVGVLPASSSNAARGGAGGPKPGVGGSRGHLGTAAIAAPRR